MNAAVMFMCVAGSVSAGQRPEVVFRAPHTEVKVDRRADKPNLYLMYHGTYLGSNYKKPAKRADYGNPEVDLSRLPTAYYHSKSPVGMALVKFNWFPGARNTYHADARFPASMIGLGPDPLNQLVNLWSEPPIAVVGLEVGTLASYARPGQTVHMVAREPNFVKLAVPKGKGQPLFSFIDDALKRGAALSVFEGDLRPTFVKHGGENFYHLIAVDFYKEPDYTVFKELLTKEGMKMLMSKLRDDGLLCYHVSNRFYEHEKTIASAAGALGYECIVGRDNGPRADEEPSAFASEWVMIARNKDHFRHLKSPKGNDKENKTLHWFTPRPVDKRFLWTDGAENSFRGIYRSDPDVFKIHMAFRAIEDFLIDDVGLPYKRLLPFTRPIDDMFWAWGARSARLKNDEKVQPIKKNPAPDDRVAFEAPLIQVRRDRAEDKEYSFLMYNRVYLGRNYQKPRDVKDNGNPNLDFSRMPTTYFHDKSPIGVVLQKYNWFPGKDNTYAADARLPASMIGMALEPWGQLVNLWSEPPITVLGMDVGTLAAYARPAQTVHFTERVPVFVKLSLPGKDEKRYFHYVQDALDRGANLKVFEGEPRTMIEKNGGDNFYQAIVIETYKLPVSGIHKELLTKEALQMLMIKVRDDGIVCYHTSNRYYELAPIIASAAKELKCACLVGKDAGDYYREPNNHRFSSEWVMVARDEKYLAHLKAPPDYDKIARFATEPYWAPVKRTDKKLIWTDKGENSFRGLYRSDPDIDKLYDVLHDIEEFFNDRVGISYSQSTSVTRPIHGLIRAWSAKSAEALNRDLPEKSKNAPKN
jgi:hypothetical protein